MEEINFIRPEEVYNRNTGESKVRYRSYDGNDRFIPVVEGEDGVPRTLVVTTHAELKAMRDAGKLTPGSLYRITDYQCTTTQANTRSAGHQFDIVLLALSANKLAEEGWAMPHDGDEYFQNSKLEAWKVWYCLDNDTARFAWADSENGTGVIYRLIDEWNNDVCYDFKNIQYIKPLTDGYYDAHGTDTWVYTFNAYNLDDSLCYDATMKNDIPIDDGKTTCKNNYISPIIVSSRNKLPHSIMYGTFSLDNDEYYEIEHLQCINGTSSFTRCFNVTSYFGNGVIPIEDAASAIYINNKKVLTEE